ncbi:MAG TPA: hypothetical protein VIK28_04750 [Sedimentisphaerales bacterium]
MNHALVSCCRFVPSIRTHHVLAVVAVLIIGLGAKQYFFPPITAEANLRAVPAINILQMHRDINMQNLSVQKVHDKTFIFVEGE